MKEFKEILVLENQSLFDIAIQEYGCPEGIFFVINDNLYAQEKITDVPPIGTKLKIRLDIPRINDKNIKIADYYDLKELKSVSGGGNLVYSNEYVDTDYVNEDYILEENGIAVLDLKKCTMDINFNNIFNIYNANVKNS